MKVLITGYKGFVGRYFCKALENHDIVGIDLVDGNDCRDFFRSNFERFDLVVHLAAIVGGRLNIEGNPLAVATDLSIDAEMFNWAVRTGQTDIVYFSSSAAYPIESQQFYFDRPLHEDDIDFNNLKLPDMTYGWSKITGEYLAQFAGQYGVRVYIFRPFSGYGPDQALDYPFPSFIKRAVCREDPFDIWGDGTQMRDFIHISDIVRATLIAFKLQEVGTYNLGTGRATSFNELANLVCEQVGYSPEFKHHGDKPVGVLKRVADITRMQTLWRPKITLEEGIAEAIEYYEATYKV